MSEKQDRARARTATDLEYRWNFGKSFAEVMGIATDARNAAEEARNEVGKLDSNLTPEEIFNRLTNNGAVQGIYRDENGNIFINAEYIVSGILKSRDENTYFNLDTGEIVALNQHDPDSYTTLHSTGFSQKCNGKQFVNIYGRIVLGVDGTEVFYLEPAEDGPMLSLPPFDNPDEPIMMTTHQVNWKKIAGIPMITDPNAEFSFNELGVNASIAEINYLAGVKSSLQSQLDELSRRIAALGG